VQTGVYYPVPIHLQEAYSEVSASLPVAERAADRVLSLPVHPGLDEADLDQIAAAVESFDSASADAGAAEQGVMDS
jgi:perosamine synthetase